VERLVVDQLTRRVVLDQLYLPGASLSTSSTSSLPSVAAHPWKSQVTFVEHYLINALTALRQVLQSPHPWNIDKRSESYHPPSSTSIESPHPWNIDKRSESYHPASSTSVPTLHRMSCPDPIFVESLPQKRRRRRKQCHTMEAVPHGKGGSWARQRGEERRVSRSVGDGKWDIEAHFVIVIQDTVTYYCHTDFRILSYRKIKKNRRLYKPRQMSRHWWEYFKHDCSKQKSDK
jgi:hypothetical protein